VNVNIITLINILSDVEIRHELIEDMMLKMAAEPEIKNIIN
jgi:hypothetical protein